MHNKLQAKFSEKTECIALHIEVPDQPILDQMLASIHSICAVNLFMFSAVLSAIFSYPDDAQDNPGAYIRAPVSTEESTGITLEKRRFRSNGLQEAPEHTARHSLQHVSICFEVRRWPTTAVRATVPRRKRTATWCCSLEPLVLQTVLRQ